MDTDLGQTRHRSTTCRCRRVYLKSRPQAYLDLLQKLHFIVTLGPGQYRISLSPSTHTLSCVMLRQLYISSYSNESWSWFSLLTYSANFRPGYTCVTLSPGLRWEQKQQHFSLRHTSLWQSCWWVYCYYLSCYKSLRIAMTLNKNGLH